MNRLFASDLPVHPVYRSKSSPDVLSRHDREQLRRHFFYWLSQGHNTGQQQACARVKELWRRDHAHCNQTAHGHPLVLPAAGHMPFSDGRGTGPRIEFDMPEGFCRIKGRVGIFTLYDDKRHE